MQNDFKNNFNSLKPSLNSSLAMAFAGMGDAFLYPFLPLYSTSIGIPVAWVGFLLSVNRFARIFLSPLVLAGFRNFGVRNITILASVLAVFSTIGYGLNLGLAAWILCRVVWGLCFSALRISTATYAVHSNKQGLRLGLSAGIYEIGPFLALLAGPLIVLQFDLEHSFYILAAVSSISLFFAYNSPALQYIPAREERTVIIIPSITNVLTFFTSFITEGVLIITIGFFIQQYYTLSIPEVASIAAGFLLFRRVCHLVVSPVGGVLVDRAGLRKMLIVSLLCINLGVIFIVSNALLSGLILVFSFSAVINVIFPIAASMNAKNKIRAIAQNSIFRDAGAACGTLVGGLLLQGIYLNDFLMTGVVLQFFLVLYWNKTVKLP